MSERLTEDEREALYAARGRHGEVVAAVEAILAARLAEAPRVEIIASLGEPAHCKVWRHGVLVFAGQDYSAALALDSGQEE